MGDTTGISWTDATWNPVRGCSRVSAGCQNCYAEVQAARIVRMGKGKPTAYDGLVRVTAGGEPRWTGAVRLAPEALALPLSWRKPRRIFVNSMSDLFHESLDDDAIDQVFAIMALARQHTYQVLTKRADRMRRYITTPGRNEAWSRHIRRFAGRRPIGGVGEEWWPRFSKHIWLGVSVENQAAADERVPELLRTPAAVRFLSCEPLLGPVNISAVPDTKTRPAEFSARYTPLGDLDWVIAGCESGRGARPCSVEWLRSLRDQCAAAGVAFFLKQASQPGSEAVGGPLVTPGPGSKRKAGGVIELPYLDGVQHAAFPEAK